ncbi:MULTISPECIES: hypothetical protein [unclassified Streptomyces]|uniref:hypothetical protein n=1 Tax=unclassified Streptomyces TaxID=2593676 RepID=UPI0033B9CDA8
MNPGTGPAAAGPSDLALPLALVAGLATATRPRPGRPGSAAAAAADAVPRDAVRRPCEAENPAPAHSTRPTRKRTKKR